MKILRVEHMNILNVCRILLLSIFAVSANADERHFLTVDELVENNYVLLSGQQILEIMNQHSIKVVNIETEAVTVSMNDSNSANIDREFVEKKSGKASSFLDPRLMARAPRLEGKVERKVVGDELIATDGVRTYHYRLYKKQDKIYAVRDIDNGNVFLEVKIK